MINNDSNENYKNNDINTLLFSNDYTLLVNSSLLLAPKSTRSKIEAGLFTNPLISESDLLLDEDYDYDPEIINNITRYENSDRWFCTFTKCKSTGDKWFLMKHTCKKR